VVAVTVGLVDEDDKRLLVTVFLCLLFKQMWSALTTIETTLDVSVMRTLSSIAYFMAENIHLTMALTKL